MSNEEMIKAIGILMLLAVAVGIMFNVVFAIASTRRKKPNETTTPKSTRH